MTDRDLLYRAVCASPADDTPRLVMADYLEEHDEPQLAEFVRLQCAMEHTTCDCLDPSGAGGHGIGCDGGETKRRPLVKRSNELFLSLAGGSPTPFGLPPTMSPCLPLSYVARFGDYDNPVQGCAELRRGFPARLRCRADTWLAVCGRVAWRPEWRVLCPGCHYPAYAYNYETGCSMCKDTGGVSEPFMLTALPLELVTLTTPLNATKQLDGPAVFTAATPAGEPFRYTVRRPKRPYPAVGGSGFNMDAHLFTWAWPGIRFVFD